MVVSKTWWFYPKPPASLMLPRLSSFILLISLLALGQACTTEDIDPVVTLRIDSLRNGRLAENGGIGYLTASLNGKSKKDVTLRFSFTGTAVTSTDYTVSGSEMRIPAGETIGRLSLTALDNNLEGGDKSILVQVVSTDHVTALQGSPQNILISDDDRDTDGDGLVDALDDCPTDSGSIANHGCPPGFGLTINEVLYDPAAGTDGDANGDGVTDKYQDGFVELVNNSGTEQDLSGFIIADLDIASGTSTDRFTFPPNTRLGGKKALVVFGGGNPTGAFGGSLVLKVGTQFGLSMQNQDEKILIKDPQGHVILTFDSEALSNNPDESYTRNPDITGDFVQHGSVILGKLFSPGTKTDGSSF